MAPYYNRFHRGNKYVGRSAIDTASGTVIPYSKGPAVALKLRSGLSLNNTASATTAFPAEEGDNPA